MPSESEPRPGARPDIISSLTGLIDQLSHALSPYIFRAAASAASAVSPTTGKPREECCLDFQTYHAQPQAMAFSPIPYYRSANCIEIFWISRRCVFRSCVMQPSSWLGAVRDAGESALTMVKDSTSGNKHACSFH